MKNIPIHVCAKTAFVTLTAGVIFLLFTCMHLWAWEIFTKSGWSACVPTAYEVVRDWQKFEKHWYSLSQKCVGATSVIHDFIPWRWGGSDQSVDAYLRLHITHSPDDRTLESDSGMIYWQGKTEELERNPAPVPLCPPQIPLGLPGREHGPPRWEAGD
jgi:hypothetical protein